MIADRVLRPSSSSTDTVDEFRRLVKWTIVGIVVGEFIGWIAVLYFDAGSLVPRPMLSVAHFISRGAGPTKLDLLIGGALSVAALVGLPAYLWLASKFIAPGLRQK